MSEIKNLLLAVLIIVFFTAAAYFYSEPIFLFFVGAFVFTLLMSVLSAIAVLPSIKIDLYGNGKTVDTNTTANITAEIRFGGIILVPRCKLEFEIKNEFYNEVCPFKMETSLAGIIKPIKINIPIRSSHCGKLSVTLKKIRMSDLMNMVSLGKKYDISYSFAAVAPPKKIPFDISGLNTDAVGDEGETEVPSYVGNVMTGIVPAGANADMRNIHWKMTARKNEIMKKEFSESVSQRTVVFAEFYKNYDTNDNIISMLRTVCMNLLSLNKTFSIAFPSKFSEELFEMQIENEETVLTAVLSAYSKAAIDKPIKLPHKGGAAIIIDSPDRSPQGVRFTVTEDR